ncbi:hypothetical protein DNTS_014960 [Danionella cerebrum]|uniref:C2H2-type domain-containing protein n=1 Tax=Danionella cerebrum TaxID=2873325 RepID=A0A553R6N3_9TELE|nr:hypothetical protein DNTS_014960 [Danionella translucida]
MMDDSDQDFSHLCSRLLKRVRRKDKVDSGDEKNNNPPKRRKRTKDDVKADRKPKFTSRTQPVAVSQGVSGSEKIADVVLRRMQQFKRASPERLLHAEDNQETTKGSEGNVPAPVTVDVSGDEALALQLQLEMDREAQVAGDLEDGGLFFCQLCQKDLSSMSPSLRTQHINRCLDACEVSAPSTSHNSRDRPRIPECPVCGKNFKSEKSRSVHLKRCSADLGVKPNVLVEALRRQAVETERESTGDQSHQRGTSAARRNGVPVKKRDRKAQKLDEDTMVALALSRSLLEQEKEREEKEQEILAQLSSPPGGTAPVLKWKPGAGKGRGKRRKGLFPLQPPLLLIQDSQAALNRLQERVSSLLLCSRPPSPPTPTLSPSVLPFKPHGRLWDRSALHGGGPTSISEFYTAELSCFIQPMETPEVRPPFAFKAAAILLDSHLRELTTDL